MAASGEVNGGCSGAQSPLRSSSTGSSPSNNNGPPKMVRKRMASEMASSLNNPDYDHAPRFPRRTSHLLHPPNRPCSNYPTTTNSTSSSLSAAGAAAAAINPTPLLGGCTDSTALPDPQPSAPLSVCGFSGLPLFPADRSSRTAVPIQEGAPKPTDHQDPSATAWIDGVIRDLIHSSTSISIPQLIQNVRDIIFPCNPNLGALLEYRLRTLMLLDPSDPCLYSINNQPFPQLHQISANPSPSSLAPLLSLNQAQQLPRPQLPPPQPQPQPQPPPQRPQPHKQQSLQERENSSPDAVETASSTPATNAPYATAAAIRERKEEMKRQKQDEEGLHLLTLLLQCAEAVSADNLEEANRLLLEISQLSTPYGTSAQRVAAYFSEAMSARLLNSCLGIYAALPSRWMPQTHSLKMVSAFQVFNGISPLVKFSHFTANQAIQEAFEREERVHIIDLDIMQGLQWPGLFHILASRPGGPPHVRLTGLGTSMEALQATGKRLSDFADKLGLPFEFCPVAEKVGNLDPGRLDVSKREAVAVHWLQHSLYDVTGSDTHTLWLLQRYIILVTAIVIILII